MPRKIAKLAGFGAFGAIALFLAIFLWIVLKTLPRSSSGMTPVLDIVTWISIGLVIVALALTHVIIARQLLYIGRGGGPKRI